jgi:hypothetical protein
MTLKYNSSSVFNLYIIMQKGKLVLLWNLSIGLHLRQALATLNNYTSRSHAYCKSVKMGSPSIIVTLKRVSRICGDRNIKLGKVSPHPSHQSLSEFHCQRKKGTGSKFCFNEFLDGFLYANIEYL